MGASLRCMGTSKAAWPCLALPGLLLTDIVITNITNVYMQSAYCIPGMSGTEASMHPLCYTIL